MSDHFNSDDFLDLGKYGEYTSDKSFDLDDILGVSLPKIEPEVIPAPPAVKPAAVEAKVSVEDIAPVIETKAPVAEPTPLQNTTSAPVRSVQVQKEKTVTAAPAEKKAEASEKTPDAAQAEQPTAAETGASEILAVPDAPVAPPEPVVAPAADKAAPILKFSSPVDVADPIVTFSEEDTRDEIAVPSFSVPDILFAGEDDELDQLDLDVTDDFFFVQEGADALQEIDDRDDAEISTTLEFVAIDDTQPEETPELLTIPDKKNEPVVEEKETVAPVAVAIAEEETVGAIPELSDIPEAADVPELSVPAVELSEPEELVVPEVDKTPEIAKTQDDSEVMETPDAAEPEATAAPADKEFHFNVAAFDRIKAKSIRVSPVESDEDASDASVKYTIPSVFNGEQATEEAAEEVVPDLPDEAVVEEESPTPKQQVIEEYSSIEEREDVLFGLKSLLRKISVKIAFVTLLFLGNVYLLLTLFGPFGRLVPSMIDPSKYPANYCLVCLALSVIHILLNISPLFEGFKKWFTGRMTADGVSLVLGVVSVLFNLYFFLNPEKFAEVMINFDIFFAVSVLFNLIGKRLLVKHICKNFALISEDECKVAIGRPKSSAIDNDIMVETGNGGDVLYAARSNTVSGYLNKAFAEQNMNHKADVFVFICFALIAFFGLTAWLFKLLPLPEVAVLVAALFSVGAPVFSVWTYTLYIFKLGEFLRSKETMISGRDGAKELSESGVLVIRDTDMINCDDIGLVDMRIQSGYNANEIVMLVAALFRKVDGPLNGFFDRLLDDPDAELPIVLDPYYHERLGFTFTANDHSMAVGCAEFMKQLHVKLPDLPHEENVIMICVAIDNKLIGIFNVVYRVSSSAARSLKMLEREGIAVAIVTNDFNLSEDMFADALEDPDSITILSSATAEQCQKCCEAIPRVAADVITKEGIYGMAYGLSGCGRLLLSCFKHNAYRIAALLFGLLSVAAVVLFGAQSPRILLVQILLYHILWNLPNVFRAFRVKY